ncbi:cap methyltransferase 2 [Colletes latitarsis]|uniref:cap methyltransferase 2 n=1 Tax=Colletes latitarsis TaxID=2605962 RepID=UPI0040351244
MEIDEHVLEKEQKPFTTKNLSNHEEQLENNYVEELFNKRFLIAHCECYLLPESKALFNDCLWEIDKLQILKHELNEIKSNLNNYDLHEWQTHTYQRSSAKDVMIRLKRDIKPEFLTQAWCKFYEIVSSFPLVPMNHINYNNKRFKSVHLCEAPGAFVTSLNHWLQTNVPSIEWDWIATTLNPYYEGNSLSTMIDDDRFIKHTLNHWCFGEDNTGNLMDLKNLDMLVKLSEPHSDVFLVTADGSIDCVDVPEDQENVVAHLHFCETVTALHLLNTGGSFLLKMFTIFECHSVCLIYLLSCCFGDVNIVKPATSKEGNSEIYVVCTDFKGQIFVSPYLEKLREHYECGSKRAMFSKDDLPNTFIERIIECSEFFKSQQCLIIMNNITTFKSDHAKLLMNIKQIQHIVANKFIKDYNVKKLISGKIVEKTILKANNSINVCNRSLQGSYNKRRERQHLTPWEQLNSIFNDFKKIQIHISPSEIVDFKVSKLPENLKIILGKIFHKVYSSKFCDRNVLKIQNSVDDILSNMEYKIQFPSIKTLNKFKNETRKTNYEILSFHYTDIYDSHEVITKICDALQNLTNEDTLILIGYSLLTHLNVGLLYLISCAFNSVELKLCKSMGLKISLNHYNYDLKILKQLLEIKTVSSNAQERGYAILEIIDASFLYESDLFFTIMDINHWIIRLFIHHLLYKLRKKIQH